MDTHKISNPLQVLYYNKKWTPKCTFFQVIHQSDYPSKVACQGIIFDSFLPRD